MKKFRIKYHLLYERDNPIATVTPYRVTLFGRRHIEYFREVKENFERVLDELSFQHPYMNFYIGNDGDFDRIATSDIRCLIGRCGKENITANLALPYPKSNIDLLEMQFNSVIILLRSTVFNRKRRLRREIIGWLKNVICSLPIRYTNAVERGRPTHGRREKTYRENLKSRPMGGKLTIK